MVVGQANYLVCLYEIHIVNHIWSFSLPDEFCCFGWPFNQVLIWNGEKCKWTEFWTRKMVAGIHFEEKILSSFFIWNGEKWKRKWISTIQNGIFFFIKNRWAPRTMAFYLVVVWLNVIVSCSDKCIIKLLILAMMKLGSMQLACVHLSIPLTVWGPFCKQFSEEIVCTFA